MRIYFSQDIPLFSVNNRSFLLILLLFLLSPLLPNYPSDCHAAKAVEYLSQTYIDTVIARAYYKLNAADDPGSGIARKEAIAYAKKIVTKMKELSENDPNRKYILWKIGELESLLYLEERGLFEEQEKKRITGMNELVAQFNAELARSRPDFSKLSMIHQRMTSIDEKKAREIFNSMVDRQTNISKEVLYTIEKSLEEDDYNKARKELAYCELNRKYLSISLTQFARLSARVESNISVDKELEFIDNTFPDMHKHIADGNLGRASELSKVVSIRLDNIKNKTIPREWDRRFFKNKRLKRQIEKSEDELVEANLAVLDTAGIYAAAEFLDTTLKKRGVGRAKIAQVDQQITEAALQLASKEDSDISKEIQELTAAPQSELIVGDMLAQAKLLAKARSEGNELTRKEKGELTQIEEVRRSRMKVKEEMEKKRQIIKELKKKEQAQESLIEIYALLEKRKQKEAQRTFEELQNFLKAYLSSADFAALESAVHKNAGKKKRRM
ncbi:MAG: hypothetical protein GF401_16915 [Chitinivibrionales bacterium]|nr:hypothetical protein [Chitinivibrionales bacterium]